ncbi:hypothetical protein HDU91_002313, partial [Kappamyces sp. JEL0680]
VSITFWALLFDASTGLSIVASTISHTFNLLLPLIDLWLCRIRLRGIHCLYPLLFSTLYMVTVVLVHLVWNQSWPYPFLVRVNANHDTGIYWGWSFLFIVIFWIVVGIFFALVLGLIWLRERAGQRTVAAKPELFVPKEHTESEMTEVAEG